ncbi:MAG: G5 domain-containing protein [Thermomicrobiales bacterium]
MTPPAPVERESDDLKSGERQQSQTARPGDTVTLTRRVVQDGAVVSEESFVSPYEAQADVFLVGKNG